MKNDELSFTSLSLRRQVAKSAGRMVLVFRFIAQSLCRSFSFSSTPRYLDTLGTYVPQVPSSRFQVLPRYARHLRASSSRFQVSGFTSILRYARHLRASGSMFQVSGFRCYLDTLGTYVPQVPSSKFQVLPPYPLTPLPFRSVPPLPRSHAPLHPCASLFPPCPSVPACPEQTTVRRWASPRRMV